MFKFLRKRGNLTNDNSSDIITESNINISDSQPILNRRYDLSNSNSVHHDLTRNEEPGKLMILF
jgi:hypothetical protein